MPSFGALAANKQDDTDASSGSDLGLSTSVGDHATHHNDLASAINNLPLNVMDFGAVGDGATHPLSGVYGSLGAAQVDYPFVTSLTQELDWAAIQLAINTAMGSGDPTVVARYPTRSVFVPGGTYMVSDQIDILSCNGFTFEGAGAGSTQLRIAKDMTYIVNCNGVTASSVGKFGFATPAIAASGTATTTLGSTSLTVVTPTTGWTNGMVITGTGIPYKTTIVSGAGTATMVVSRAATATASGVAVSGNPSCTSALNVDWVVAESARSAQFTTYHDIDIRGEVPYVHGVTIGTTYGGADVYHNRFIGVRAYGSQEQPILFTGNTTNASPVITNIVPNTTELVVGRIVYGDTIDNRTIVSIDSSTQITVSANAGGTRTASQLASGGWPHTTLWQSAFRHGQGAQGNVIFNQFFGCNGAHCKRGFWTTAAGADWWGGSLQSNGSDIYVDGAGNDRMIHFDGVRSEVSGAILTGTNGGKQDVLLTNYASYSSQIAAQGKVVQWDFGGSFRMSGCTILGSRSELPPKIVVSPPTSYCTLTIDSLSIDAASAFPSAWLTAGANTVYVVSGVQNLVSSQPAAVGLVGPVTNRVTGTVASATTVTLPEDVQLVTISGTTTITSIAASWAGREVTLVFSGALTLTKGSNLAIDRDYHTATGDTISLLYDGTNWVEQGRSVESRGMKRPVRVAAPGNVTVSAPGATIDGVTMAAGDRMLLPAQTTASENGLYVWNGAASAATRSTDADTAVKLTDSVLVTVDEGTSNKDSIFTLSTDKPITLGSTSLRFTRIHPAAAVSSHPVGSAYQPANSKLENLPRDTVPLANIAAITTAIIRVFPLGIQRAGDTLAALNFQIGTTAAVTVTNSWAGIARLSDRVILAISPTSTAAPGANTLKTFTFNSAYTADKDEVLVGFVMYQATTVPTFNGINHFNAAVMAQTPVVQGNSTTGQTTPLTVGTALAAFTADTEMIYCFAT